MAEVIEQLRAVLPPEMFEVITPIFTGLAHRLTESENRVAELQQGHISMEQLTASFREALFHNSSPPVQPVPPPQVHPATARAPLCTELPIFRGQPEDNARAFTLIAKDLLQATHISQDDWGIIISGCFHDAALTWYLAKKQENGDKLSSPCLGAPFRRLVFLLRSCTPGNRARGHRVSKCGSRVGQ
ncbi:hypothetical protein EV359DRAFT_85573 [Lentinula novae-zelandiae]|nr:hypothetical protein EV359DRAFT_85573 [Lentinula novae-zelandiae]